VYIDFNVVSQQDISVVLERTDKAGLPQISMISHLVTLYRQRTPVLL